MELCPSGPSLSELSLSNLLVFYIDRSSIFLRLIDSSTFGSVYFEGQQDSLRFYCLCCRVYRLKCSSHFLITTVMMVVFPSL